MLDCSSLDSTECVVLEVEHGSTLQKAGHVPRPMIVADWSGGYRPLVDTPHNHFARLNKRYSPTHTPPTPTIISG